MKYKLIYLLFQLGCRFYRFNTDDTYNSYCLKIFYIPVISYHNSYSFNAGWIKLFTRRFGIGWKDLTKNPMLFSERNGYGHFIIIGKYLIGII